MIIGTIVLRIWRLPFGRCATGAVVFLPLVLHAEADDLRVACASKTSAVDAMACLSETKDSCKALSHWQTLTTSPPSQKAVDDAEKTVTKALQTACADQENLRMGDYLFGKRRFAEALSAYNKINDPASLPAVTDRARRGRRLSTELSGSLVLPPPNVLELERQRRFEDAYRLLSLAVPEIDPHRKNLAQLLQLQHNAASFENRREYDAELKNYQSFLGGLDRVRDSHLYDAADLEIERLEPMARQLADQDAQSLIDSAELQIKHALYSDAATTLAQATGKSGVSPAIAEHATALQANLRLIAAKEPTIMGTLLSFFWSIPKAALALLSWFSYALVLVGALVVVWIFSRIARRLRRQKSILLSMTDQTSSAGIAANQNLSEALRREMDLPRPGRDLRIDTAGEMDGSSLGQLSLRIPFKAAETIFQSGTAVSVGPFSINPVQILSQIASWFDPSYRLEIAGSLVVVGADTICTARLASGKLADKGPWEGVASGDNARDQAIRDASMKVLLAIDGEVRAITENARSLSQLRLGMDLQRRALDNPDNAAALWGQARASFQQAVLQDPANWLARFNLANTQRTLGLNSLAAEQFEELTRMARLPKRYLPVVRYNYAAALQKTDDDDLAQRSIKVLTEILADPTLDADLRPLASSGKLAATAVRFSRKWRRYRRIGAKRELQDFKQEVETARDEGTTRLKEIESAIAENHTPAGSDLNVVMAVILNALGQFETQLDHPEVARAQYRRALTFLPSFLEASLNLAELYLDKKTSFDVNWATRAERLLLDVQAADASNIRCRILLGTLYANPVFARVDKAIEQLTSALPDPNAAQRLGGILFEQGKPADAIAPLLSAIAQDTSLGSGHLLLTRCALALDAADRRKCELLRRADAWMKKMANGDSGPQYKKEAEFLAPKILTALSPCSKEPDPASPAPDGQAAPVKL